MTLITPVLLIAIVLPSAITVPGIDVEATGAVEFEDMGGAGTNLYCGIRPPA